MEDASFTNMNHKFLYRQSVCVCVNVRVRVRIRWSNWNRANCAYVVCLLLCVQSLAIAYNSKFCVHEENKPNRTTKIFCYYSLGLAWSSSDRVCVLYVCCYMHLQCSQWKWRIKLVVMKMCMQCNYTTDCNWPDYVSVTEILFCA